MRDLVLFRSVVVFFSLLVAMFLLYKALEQLSRVIVVRCGIKGSESEE